MANKKNTKLVYQIFNVATNKTEERTVTVTSKENCNLVIKGIKAERESVMRDARLMFTHAFIELTNKYFKNHLSVRSRVQMEEKRPGARKGAKQKVDLILTSKKGDYAIVLENTAFSAIDHTSSAARSNHIYKTYRGRSYTFEFKDFITAASKVDKYAEETLDVLEEMQSCRFLPASIKLPSFEEVRACFDTAVEMTVNEKDVAVIY
jgi:hydrogenase maturation factor